MLYQKIFHVHPDLHRRTARVILENISVSLVGVILENPQSTNNLPKDCEIGQALIDGEMQALCSVEI
jgi:hypothetical protein